MSGSSNVYTLQKVAVMVPLMGACAQQAICFEGLAARYNNNSLARKNYFTGEY
jgi:hypothetical protein